MNKSKSGKRKEKKVRRWPDLLMWLVATGLSVVFCLLLYKLEMLPMQVLICAAVLVLLVDLICLVLILRRTKMRFTRWFMRLFLLLLCGALAFGDVTIWNALHTLETITTPVQTVTKTELLVKKGSSIKSLADLKEKTVAYSQRMDGSAGTAALAEIGAAADGVEFEEDTDFANLYKDLMDGKADALLIPATRISMLKEQYPDVEEDTVSIHTFENTREITSSSAGLDISKEPFVVYVGGIDSTGDPNEDGRCDTNILVMVDPVNNHMTTVSVPRDSFVPNPALGNGSDKLTHLGNDGAENSMEGLEEALGIDIDYYAKVNFNSLIHMVDALGGIDVDVKISFTEQDENRSFKKKDLITLEKGMQHLNGKEALAYARHRKTAGYEATGREQAQQQIIKAIVKKMTTAEGIARINALLTVAQEYVATDLPFSAIQKFVSGQLQNVKPWTVDSVTLKGGVDARLTTVSMPSMSLACYLLSPSDIAKVFNAYAVMFDDSKMKDFQFDLTEDPDCEIKYAVKDEVSPYMITSADYANLSQYQVYYGLDGVPQTQNQPVVQTPVYQAPQVQTPVQTPVQQPVQQPVQEPVPETPAEPVPETPVEPVPETPAPETPAADTAATE